MSIVKKPRRQRAQLSCDRCRIIKRKCNRSEPCDRCTVDQVKCSFDRASISRGALLQSRPSTSTFNQSSKSVSSDSSPTQANSVDSILDLNSAQGSETKSKRDTHHDILCLTAQTDFLKVVESIYLREISWYVDMLSGTRLERFINEIKGPSLLWDEISIHALAMTALVAQTCPSDIDICLNSMTSKSRQGFLSGRAIASAAYKAASDKIENMASFSHPQSWPSEVFASAALLRFYEKNEGLPNLDEKILVDISRMMKGKLHNTDAASTTQIRIWQAEHDLLAYRVFWHSFVEDKIVASLTGNAFAIQPHHCNICLHDPIGRIPIQTLCSDALKDSIFEECNHCDSIQHSNQLRLYEGSVSRIAAIIGRYFDRLASASSSSFHWPEDAEQMANELELDLFSLETQIDLKVEQDMTLLLPGQEDILALYIARTRRDLAKHLCDRYAMHLLQNKNKSSSMDIDPAIAVEWMLQRRRLDSAKTLITRALITPRRLSTQIAFNYVFFSKFIHHQSMELLEGVQVWLQHIDRSRNDLARSQHLEFCDYDDENRFYIECLRLAMAGRNLLVLTSQRSELQAAKKFNKLVVEKCAQVLSPFVQDVELGNEAATVDDSTILESITIYASLSKSTGDSNSSNNDDTGHDFFDSQGARHFLTSLFTDLPALEQLFNFESILIPDQLPAAV